MEEEVIAICGRKRGEEKKGERRERIGKGETAATRSEWMQSTERKRGRG